MNSSCEIPIPPSTNHLHRIVWPKGGRPFQARTAGYKSWLEHAGLLLRTGIGKIKTTPVSVHVKILGGKGFPLSRDLDNILKPIMDALQLAGVLSNDRVTEIDEVSAEYVAPLTKKDVAACLVTIQWRE